MVTVSESSRRTVHRPALVVLAGVLAVTALALGWWQWERFSSASGTAQNLGYALQWPLFAAFAVFAYFRFVRLEQESDADETDDAPRARAPRRLGRRVRTRRIADQPREIPAGFLPERPSAPRDETPVLAEYNRYLAELNAESERSAG